MKLTIAILLSAVVTASAVETKPVEVLSVVNGFTIRVKADVGGQPCPLTVRLSYISLADPIDANDFTAISDDMPSTKTLQDLLPIGSLVTLQCAQGKFECDASMRLKAIVCIDDSVSAGENSNQKRRRCIQEEMIKSGWAKFDPHEEPDFYSLYHILETAEKEARASKCGIWAMKNFAQP